MMMSPTQRDERQGKSRTCRDRRGTICDPEGYRRVWRAQKHERPTEGEPPERKWSSDYVCRPLYPAAPSDMRHGAVSTPGADASNRRRTLVPNSGAGPDSPASEAREREIARPGSDVSAPATTELGRRSCRRSRPSTIASCPTGTSSDAETIEVDEPRSPMATGERSSSTPCPQAGSRAPRPAARGSGDREHPIGTPPGRTS
jgi:hypothetical protein